MESPIANRSSGTLAIISRHVIPCIDFDQLADDASTGFADAVMLQEHADSKMNWSRAMSDFWLGSLVTDTPQAGFELAIKFSRLGGKYTQPSAEVRDRLRPQYGEDATALIASSQVVATNFQTIAAANNYWRS